MNPEPAVILEQIRAAVPAARPVLLRNPGPAGQDSILLDTASAQDVFRFLKTAPGLEFDLLSNLTGTDWPEPATAHSVGVPPEIPPPPAQGFLEVVCHLYSTLRREGPLVVRMRTADRAEGAHLPTLTPVYRSAEFQEREVFDLFGVVFEGHPDLRRILMWDEFHDFPMRRDYVAPDDYEYEPTPHEAVWERAKEHYAVPDGTSETGAPAPPQSLGLADEAACEAACSPLREERDRLSPNPPASDREVTP